ncbi:MAG TPA: OmpA family protein [Candidatus Deferrimicrobium sp.]|nr:OmpA family protein [Candidatus Deferrimicrobium sp.]
MLKRVLSAVIIAVILWPAASAESGNYRYAFGAGAGVATLTGGSAQAPKFTLQTDYGASLTYRLTDHWLLGASVSLYKLYNDSTAGSSYSFGADKAHATAVWQAIGIGVDVRRLFLGSESLVNISIGASGGLLVWKYKDPYGDSTLKVSGVHGEPVDYAASELVAGAVMGVHLAPSRHLLLTWDIRADYLTGAGAEFQSGVNSGRQRWLLGSSVGMRFAFGGKDYVADHRNDFKAQTPIASATPVAVVADHDGDGVSDDNDDCPGTPIGAVVDRRGCTTDSDGDGVTDDRDDCPGTDVRARGRVDVFGCPVDGDFDGLADYLDSCPSGPVGAQVGANGCPLDSDADGVPDGLDDCPNTLYGVAVDRFGCLDVDIFSKPLVLHIDYVSGSFEIDPANLEKIKDLARVLNLAPEIKLEINGYTDDIGTPQANQLLSEKRARRVRDYLVALAVAPERITPIGRGEKNFVASNETAEGRANNRRIEIVFYR